MVEAANAFVREVYLPDHAAPFAVAAAQPGTAFTAIHGVNLGDILCVQEERQVGNDNCVSSNRLKLQIPSPSAVRRILLTRHPRAGGKSPPRGWGIFLKHAPTKYLGVVCLLLAVAGCSGLPDSGPSRRSVETNASVLNSGDHAGLRLCTRRFEQEYPTLRRRRRTWFALPHFRRRTWTRVAILVGIGDTVQVTLFEAQSGGLFVPTDAGSRPGNFVTLPSQTVDSRGYITVPYAGQIMALNRTTVAIQQDIVNKLKDRAIEPQAIVAITSQTSTEVTVVGEVNSPNKFAINPSGDTVLDAISRAGGIKDQGYDSYVTLQRHRSKGTVYFLNLVKDPKENIFVKPGDAIYVSFYQRSFIAFVGDGCDRAIQVPAGEPDPQ